LGDSESSEHPATRNSRARTSTKRAGIWHKRDTGRKREVATVVLSLGKA